jgi:hypothetical protein
MLLIFGILLIIGLIVAVTKTKWFPYPSSWLKALGLAVPVWMKVSDLGTPMAVI